MIDPGMFALAQRMAATCPCKWLAEDRQRMVTYLASLSDDPELAADFPLVLESSGSFYRLRIRAVVHVRT